MSRKTLSALCLMAFVMSCTAVMAQDPTEESETQSAPATSPATSAADGKTFKLLRGDAAANDLNLGEEEATAWDPVIRAGDIEISLAVGFLSMNTTLLKHDQIIYKYNTEDTFWGDVELKGESAFAPTLRIGYGLTNWFGLESWYGVGISEYTSSITNTHSRKNEQGAPVVDNPPLGEFDAEARSLITLQAGINAIVYPLAIRGEGMGRLHPYLTGGVGNMWYNMNSNYTKGTASAMDLNFGGGLRLLADKNISIRFEVLLHRNTLEWTPADYFMELNEGTTLVPLNEYPVQPDGSIAESPVTEFESNTMSLLQWSLGVQGSF